MNFKKKMIGALVFSATVAMASAASAQAIRLNLGNAGLGGISATALGGGSLANVNVGSAVATIGANNGLNANIDLGGRYATGLNPPGTQTLGGDSFFSTNFSTGGGGGSSSSMQFGDTGYSNGAVTTQEARRRVVSAPVRKLKRRIATIRRT